MTTIPNRDEYEAAAAGLLDAVSLGGGFAERLRGLLVSMTEGGDSPDVWDLLGRADDKNAAALLTLFAGWRRYKTPDTLDAWRVRRAEARLAREEAQEGASEIAAEREAAAEVAAMRHAHGDPSA
ncbi:hypothetical protein [Paracoccus contaminans]|nr:hypothetical protein [Paracoccus contaminans]